MISSLRIRFITHVYSDRGGKSPIFTYHFIELACKEIRSSIFKGIAQPMLKAIVKSQLIHPTYFGDHQQAEAGVRPVEGHLSMVLPTGWVQAMFTLVVSPIRVEARA